MLKAEMDRLREIGKDDLADKVVHVSEVEGDGAGYDIRSFNDDETPLHIEVKTSKGSDKTAFFISANELAFSKLHPTTYKLIRVFNFDQNDMSGDFYEIDGDISNSLNLEATNYRAKL